MHLFSLNQGHPWLKNALNIILAQASRTAGPRQSCTPRVAASYEAWRSPASRVQVASACREGPKPRWAAQPRRGHGRRTSFHLTSGPTRRRLEDTVKGKFIDVKQWKLLSQKVKKYASHEIHTSLMLMVELNVWKRVLVPFLAISKAHTFSHLSTIARQTCATRTCHFHQLRLGNRGQPLIGYKLPAVPWHLLVKQSNSLIFFKKSSQITPPPSSQNFRPQVPFPPYHWEFSRWYQQENWTSSCRYPATGRENGGLPNDLPSPEDAQTSTKRSLGPSGISENELKSQAMDQGKVCTC